MAWHDWGNRPINSTTPQPVSNPSTGTLCAEIDSTQLGTNQFTASQSRIVQCSWLIGGDTSATWQIETCASTALNSGVDIAFVRTPTGQTGQFVTQHVLEKDYRIRARVQSTFTGSVTAFIQAIPMT